MYISQDLAKRVETALSHFVPLSHHSHNYPDFKILLGEFRNAIDFPDERSGNDILIGKIDSLNAEVERLEHTVYHLQNEISESHNNLIRIKALMDSMAEQTTRGQ